MDAVMVDPSVSMKRPMSPSSLTQMENESKKKEKTDQEIFYAVFESFSVDHREAQFFVHKVDYSSSLQQADGAGGTDLPMMLGEPIWSLDRSKSALRFRFKMIVFSEGPIIYFVGGYEVVHHFAVYRPEAYALDLTKSGELYQIGSMDSPKPFPFTFGPIEGKLYVITHTLFENCSFESLDLSTKKWKSLPTLESVPALNRYYNREFDLKIDASAVCNSNICLSTPSGLFMFFTKTLTWRSFGRFYPPSLNIPTNLPFVGQAHSLTVGGENFFLASGQPEAKPQVYKSTRAPVDEDYEMKADQPLDEDLPLDQRFVKRPLEDCYKHIVVMNGVKELWQKVTHGEYADICEKRPPADFFNYFGQVEGLEGWEEHWAKEPYELHDDYPALEFFYFNEKPRICSVYSGYEHYGGDDSGLKGCYKGFEIDIWDLDLMDSVKVKGVKTVTYEHIGDEFMIPRHFFFAA